MKYRMGDWAYTRDLNVTRESNEMLFFNVRSKADMSRLNLQHGNDN